MFGLSPQEFIIRIPALFYAITIHEFAHAYTAWRCGDDTAKQLGRITLNPLAHLDLIGTICMLIGTFGWGKPVPVNPSKFRNKRWHDVLVAFAGPLSNFISALVFGFLLRLIHGNPSLLPAAFAQGVFHLLYLLVIMNLGLAFFNLLPIFPLDGSHVLRGFLPRSKVPAFDQFSSRAPMLLLMILLVESMTNLRIISAIIRPPVAYFFMLFTGA